MNNPLQKAPATMFGMRVIVLEPFAKLQISTSFEWIGNDARDAINDWLKDTFGYTEYTMLEKKNSYIIDKVRNVIYTDAAGYNRLINAQESTL